MCVILSIPRFGSIVIGALSGVDGDFERVSLSNLEGLDLERVFTGGLCLEVEGLDRESSEDFELSECFEL